MNAPPVIRVAAAVVLDADGRMLVVRKRGIDAIAWVDPADPGDIALAPLTEQLTRASHCGGRAPAADS